MDDILGLSQAISFSLHSSVGCSGADEGDIGALFLKIGLGGIILYYN